LRNSNVSSNFEETEDLLDNLRGATNVDSDEIENQMEFGMNQIPNKLTLERIY